jgi:hypothetical protein
VAILDNTTDSQFHQITLQSYVDHRHSAEGFVTRDLHDTDQCGEFTFLWVTPSPTNHQKDQYKKERRDTFEKAKQKGKEFVEVHLEVDRDEGKLGSTTVLDDFLRDDNSQKMKRTTPVNRKNKKQKRS